MAMWQQGNYGIHYLKSPMGAVSVSYEKGAYVYRLPDGNYGTPCKTMEDAKLVAEARLEQIARKTLEFLGLKEG